MYCHLKSSLDLFQKTEVASLPDLTSKADILFQKLRKRNELLNYELRMEILATVIRFIIIIVIAETQAWSFYRVYIWDTI